MTWTLSKVKEQLNLISKEKGDTFSIPVTINSRLTRTLGRVISVGVSGDVAPRNMEFSKQFLETSSDESIIGVIRHEWAHYYITKTTLENHGHDAAFKALCDQIGTHGSTSVKVERTVEVKYKYELSCAGCGTSLGGYSRKCKTTDMAKDGLVTSRCCNKKAIVKQNW